MKTIEEYKRQWLASRESLPKLELTQVREMTLSDWQIYFGDCDSPSPSPSPASLPALDPISSAILESLKPHIERLLPSAQATRSQANKETVITIKDAEIIGKIEGTTHWRLPTVVSAISANVPLILRGPAGSAKSTLAKQASELLGLKFIPQTFDPQMSVGRLLGFLDANSHYVATPFRLAYEHGGLFVADEFDACSASVALTLNTAIANGYCYFPDNTLVNMHPDFRFVACANTNGLGASAQYCGRNRLDASTLDRFAVLEIGYDNRLEASLIGIDEECHHAISKASPITADVWLKSVRAFRSRLNDRNIDAICSPRAVILGMKLLQVGIAYPTVCEMVLGKGRVSSDLLENLI